MPIVTRDIVRMSRLLEIAQGEPNNESGDLTSEFSENNPLKSYQNTLITSNNISAEINNEDSNISIEIEETRNCEEGAVGSILTHSYLNTDIEPISNEIYDKEESTFTEFVSPVNSNLSKNMSKHNKKRSVSPVGNVKRLSWTLEEKEAALTCFNKHIEDKTLPSTEECYNAICENSQLQNRSPIQLKAWISNQIKKQDKMNMKRRERRSTVYWSIEEKELIKQIFYKHFEAKKLPSFKECTDAIAKYPLLTLRTKETIKVWISSEMKRNQRLKKKLLN